MTAKSRRLPLDARRHSTPSVKEMAPVVTVDNDAEENSMCIAMGNNLLVVGRRDS